MPGIRRIRLHPTPGARPVQLHSDLTCLAWRGSLKLERAPVGGARCESATSRDWRCVLVLMLTCLLANVIGVANTTTTPTPTVRSTGCTSYRRCAKSTVRKRRGRGPNRSGLGSKAGCSGMCKSPSACTRPCWSSASPTWRTTTSQSMQR